MKSPWILIVFSLFLCLSGFTRQRAHQVTIRFDHYVGQAPLQLSDTAYHNSFGEPFTVEQFKYYVSGIVLIAKDGAVQAVDAGPFLIDQADPASRLLPLSTSLSSLQSIRFIIGVDSITNTGGVKTGDLDPMLGMFWTWNTGYIYTRLEGQSDSAHAPAHRYTWDIGGYKPGINAARTVVMPLNGIKENLVIKVDLLRLFDGVHPVRISQNPVCHEPGELAMRLADNYATLFSSLP